jgi:hypothetical protein
MEHEYSTKVMADRWITILRQKAEYEHQERKQGKETCYPSIDDICNEMIAYFSGVLED